MQRHIKRWDVLLELVRQNGWRKGAEIGVLNGATFFHLLDNVPGLEMTAVDKWAADNPIYGDMRPIGEEFRLRARAFGDRVTILQGNSGDMAHDVKDGSLDFCFIDADHSTEAARADIAAWAPKVRQGGKVIGHDIDFPSVEAAVREFGNYRTLPDDVWMLD